MASLVQIEAKQFFSADDDLSKFRKRARKYYRQKLKPLVIRCPAIGNREVHFTEKGWKHIILPSRNSKDIFNRLRWLPLVPEVISGSENYKPGKRSSNIYEFFGIQEDNLISVVLEEDEHDIHFLSVRRERLTQKKKAALIVESRAAL